MTHEEANDLLESVLKSHECSIRSLVTNDDTKEVKENVDNYIDAIYQAYKLIRDGA